MEESLKEFTKQFSFEPEIQNADSFKKAQKFIICGMGGSNLASGLLKVWKPELDITIHRNYGLPGIPEKELRESLVILSSYSGNTEEVLDAYKIAQEMKLNTLAISTGGELLETAQKDNLPYIKLRDMKIQPRSAVALSFIAFLKAVGEENAIADIKAMEKSFNPLEYKERGQEISATLKRFVPMIYSSEKNKALAYIWKITFNETGKIPAFYNILPELNHNEMTGFDTMGDLSKNFHFLFIKDKEDHPRVVRRFEVLEELFKKRGYEIESVILRGETPFHKIFSQVVLAGWTSLYTAEAYGFESEEVPMVEEFKKIIE